MKTLKFTKMEGSGNDFVIIEGRGLPSLLHHPSSIVRICDRKYGIGADGVLWLGPSGKADVRMRIFNADGTEAEMCGNGARCATFFIGHKIVMSPRVHQVIKSPGQKKITLETKAGIIEAEIKGDFVRLKMTDPKDLRLDLDIYCGEEEYALDFVNTGVPHAVIEVADIEKTDVKDIGRLIRHHPEFAPAGTNVNFVQVADESHIFVRTYERGVEDETLACGTGSVASAVITALKKSPRHFKGDRPQSVCRRVNVKTRGGEILGVYFKMTDNKISDVWLQGKAKIVYTGEFYV